MTCREQTSVLLVNGLSTNLCLFISGLVDPFVPWLDVELPLGVLSFSSPFVSSFVPSSARFRFRFESSLSLSPSRSLSSLFPSSVSSSNFEDFNLSPKIRGM